MNQILGKALNIGASDIHLESGDRNLMVRFRIDGVLKEPYLGSIQEDINRNVKELISRIKIIGKLDISERRRPQDGSFRARILKDNQSVKIDFRISIIPGYYGESVVIRILDGRKAPKTIDELGFSEKITRQLHQINARPQVRALLIITRL